MVMTLEQQIAVQCAHAVDALLSEQSVGCDSCRALGALTVEMFDRLVDDFEEIIRKAQRVPDGIQRRADELADELANEEVKA